MTMGAVRKIVARSRSRVLLMVIAGLAAIAPTSTTTGALLVSPFIPCRWDGRDQAGRRWVITGWEPCVRAWGNPPCPCLHSDPQVPDCPPGETRRVRGWLSFYEGADVDAELPRLRDLAFGARSR